MKERPLLFSAPMVRAIQNDTKTQTRRVAKFKPREEGINLTASSLHAGHYFTGEPAAGFVLRSMGGACWNDRTFPLKSPYGIPGDRYYVKEATWIWCKKVADGTTKKGRVKYRYIPEGRHVVYCADSPKPAAPAGVQPDCVWKYKTGRFMPRWAAREFLEQTASRIERLNSISEGDAVAEGIQTPCVPDFMPCLVEDISRPYACAYAGLWEKINGLGSWRANPWVFAVSLRRLV